MENKPGQEILNVVSRNIFLARKLANLRQSDIADSIGVSEKAIYKWENGLVEPRWSHLGQLAKFLNLAGAGLWFYQDRNEDGTIRAGAATAPAPQALASVQVEEEMTEQEEYKQWLEWQKWKKKNGTYDGGLTVCKRGAAANFNNAKSLRTLLAPRLAQAQNVSA